MSLLWSSSCPNPTRTTTNATKWPIYQWTNLCPLFPVSPSLLVTVILSTPTPSIPSLLLSALPSFPWVKNVGNLTFFVHIWHFKLPVQRSPSDSFWGSYCWHLRPVLSWGEFVFPRAVTLQRFEVSNLDYVFVLFKKKVDILTTRDSSTSFTACYSALRFQSGPEVQLCSKSREGKSVLRSCHLSSFISEMSKPADCTALFGCSSMNQTNTHTLNKHLQPLLAPSSLKLSVKTSLKRH